MKYQKLDLKKKRNEDNEISEINELVKEYFILRKENENLCDKIKLLESELLKNKEDINNLNQIIDQLETSKRRLHSLYIGLYNSLNKHLINPILGKDYYNNYYNTEDVNDRTIRDLEYTYNVLKEKNSILKIVCIIIIVISIIIII